MERHRSNSDLYRSRSNTSGTLNATKRQNLVLSTSFVSTRRFEDGVTTPTSPLQTKHRSNTVNSIRTELAQLEYELGRQRKRKEDNEKFKQSSNTNDIYEGKYSTDHIERHSMRLRANSEIRDTDISIRRLSDQVRLLKLKLKKADMNSSESVTPIQEKVSINGSYNHSLSEISDTGSEMQSSVENYELTPTKSTPVAHITGEEMENSSEHNSSSMLYESPTKETATWLISDHLQSLQDMGASQTFILRKANGLVNLLSRNPDIKEDLVITAFGSTIQNLLLNSDKTIRSAGYRIVRYLILNTATIDFMLKLHLDIFLTISLGKDNAHQMEKEQALKLIRTLLEFEGYGVNKPIIQAVVSCVESPDDILRSIALETLVEFAFIIPNVVEECHAFPLIISSLLDPNEKFVTFSMNSIVEMLSYPKTRGYVTKHLHPGILLGPFSEPQSKTSGNVGKIQAACDIIVRLLQDFNGLLLFAHNDYHLLTDLVSLAQSPVLFKYVVNIFIRALRVKKNFPEVTDCPQMRQFVDLIIVMLISVNFPLNLIRDASFTLSKMDDATKDNTRLLIIKLFSSSFQLKKGLEQFLSMKFPKNASWEKLCHETLTFSNIIHKLDHTTIKTYAQQLILDQAKRMKLDALRREVDEVGFKQMVYDSKVLQTKAFKNWNWQVIGELCKGPLLNGRRLDELAKSTKFVRRVLVFYRPFRFRFSDLPIDDPMGKAYINSGCEFFRMLLSNDVGVRILNDDSKILPQFASVLYNNMQGNYVNDKLFTEQALNNTLCSGYFKMLIGVFMENKYGMALLEKWNIFTVINKMFLKKPICLTYLSFLLPELNLKYSRCKIFLNKALLNERESIRIAGTRIIGAKLESLNEGDLKLEEYLLKMLCRQLYDLSSTVVAIADKFLYEYCLEHVSSSKILQHSLKRSLDQLIFIGSPTLLKLMETSEGFLQLHGLDYVNAERIAWIEYKNKEYVNKAEKFLKDEMENVEKVSKKSFPLHFYHFLSKSLEGANLLSKYDDVRRFANCIKKAVNDPTSLESDEDILELKSCLWTCGFIGSTENGILLLDQYRFVQDIVQLANESPYTSIKQTAFYVLGLLSNTMEGREMIEEMGWDSVMDFKGCPCGVSVPQDARKLLHWSDLGPIKEPPKDIKIEWKELINSKACYETHPNIVIENESLSLDSLLHTINEIEDFKPDKKKEERQLLETTMREIAQEPLLDLPKVFEDDLISEKILKIVSDLGNNILLNGAIKDITALEANYGPQKFQNPEMLDEIFRLMGEYRFKPSVRKFLLELFINNKALENLIRNERRRKR